MPIPFTATSTRRLLLAMVASAAPAAHAGWADCSSLADDKARLACFDAAAAKLQAGADNAEADRPAAKAAPPAVSAHATPTLSDLWELGPENRQGTFRLRPFRPNYLVATYNNAPNTAPYAAFKDKVPAGASLAHDELAFQLGFKFKVIEQLAGTPLDLWAGYTQRSFWQADNQQLSSPFRETNYQPEVIATLPLALSLAGMQARVVNLGLVHESNGQGGSLSRSWNRIYAQLGIESGDATLVTRIWRRLKEPADTDDNPDIIDFMGRGDVEASYRWRGHSFSMLARYNFQSHKGGTQLGWTFPITSQLRGYVQAFSGYGYSLIDYNASQKVVGTGILLNY